MIAKYAVIIIFIVTYYFIIFGKVNKSVIAFSMGLLAALIKVSDNLKIESISEYVDFNTIGILIGMMIVVGILKTTGIFQAIAGYIVKASKGKVVTIFLITLATVAFLSSILDNVTTLLLFSPVILLICQEADIKPEYFIFPMIFAANIGGTATMLGDPPNILVASASKTSFLEFMAVMIIPTLIAFAISVTYFLFVYKDIKKATPDKFKNFLKIEPAKAITNKKLLIQGTIIFAVVIAGFLLHEYLDYEAALIALTGGAIMMLVSSKSFEEVSKEIEWDTIFFFIGLFTIVKAMEDTAVISDLTNLINNFSDRPKLMIIGILWITGIMSAFMGAVPAVTVFIPIVQNIMTKNPYGGELWWALALGASFGGNGTISGAASNMVVVGLLESSFKKKIKFWDFMKIGAVVSLIGLLVSTGYLIVRMNMLY
ncbi:MAG: ArsB/NhaD family transporter [Thermotogae bacterium]|nr:ArsB/NhaD family transporter [Thermotogota bacterium]MCP5465616.1 ArsB/NhaD family transporter [Thermotogota bacterium]HOO74670.1 ArsB/NhaD family transporter [Tepiditoga sp.]